MKRKNKKNNPIGMRFAIAIQLVLALNTGFANTISFEPAMNFATGGTTAGASPIATGDFNGDTNLDLVTANGSSNNIAILLGIGNGTFGLPQTIAVGTTPVSVKAADFNGDTNLDLAVANSNSDSISILLGNGDGTFVSSTGLILDNPHSLVLADFNSDGNIDIVTTQSGIHLISIFLGNGDGSFGTATSYDVGAFQNPTSVVTADFDNNGSLDLAVTNERGSGISAPNSNVFILPGDGNGGFGPTTSVAVGIRPTSLVTDDFNEDGKPDLAVSNHFSFNLSILLGNGNGSFVSFPNVPISTSNPGSLASGDFNLDGFSDLSVSIAGSSQIAFFAGNGDGTFGPVISFFPGSTGELAVGDYNSDGLLDLAARKLGESNIAILINNTIVTSPYTAQIQQPIDADGSSVFNAKRGVVPVKFTLSLDSAPTCDLPAATIAVFRTANNVNQPVDESIYSMPADNGSNFRIDGCQYVYNLAVASFGPGSYMVHILINGTTIGSATFGMK